MQSQRSAPVQATRHRNRMLVSGTSTRHTGTHDLACQQFIHTQQGVLHIRIRALGVPRIQLVLDIRTRL